MVEVCVVMIRTKALMIGAFILVCGVSLGAALELTTLPGKHIAAEPLRRVPDVPVRATTTATSLRVENVRLEAVPETDTEPATLVTFDVVNVGAQRLTDVLLEISVRERPAPVPRTLTPPRTLVHPFQIRGDAILESGYTITYEMQLRHFSSDCECVAYVDVLSARAVPDPN